MTKAVEVEVPDDWEDTVDILREFVGNSESVALAGVEVKEVRVDGWRSVTHLAFVTNPKSAVPQNDLSVQMYRAMARLLVEAGGLRKSIKYLLREWYNIRRGK